MKAQLTYHFDMNDEDDAANYRELVSDNGRKLKSAMWEFSQMTLRAWDKYGIPKDEFNFVGMDPDQIAHTVVSRIREKFYLALEADGASLEDA